MSNVQQQVPWCAVPDEEVKKMREELFASDTHGDGVVLADGVQDFSDLSDSSRYVDAEELHISDDIKSPSRDDGIPPWCTFTPYPTATEVSEVKRMAKEQKFTASRCHYVAMGQYITGRTADVVAEVLRQETGATILAADELSGDKGGDKKFMRGMMRLAVAGEKDVRALMDFDGEVGDHCKAHNKKQCPHEDCKNWSNPAAHRLWFGPDGVYRCAAAHDKDLREFLLGRLAQLQVASAEKAPKVPKHLCTFRVWADKSMH